MAVEIGTGTSYVLVISYAYKDVGTLCSSSSTSTLSLSVCIAIKSTVVSSIIKPSSITRAIQFLSVQSSSYLLVVS